MKKLNLHNQEEFFKKLQPGEIFTYTLDFDAQEVIKLAKQDGVEVSYCKPNSIEYLQYGCYTVKVIESKNLPALKTYNQVEALIRKHFQQVNREGVGFLESNIKNLTRELCETLNLPVLITPNEYMELEDPEFVGQTKLNNKGEYEMHWKLDGKFYYTLNKAPYFKPRSDERDRK